jgi:hypothetical protein
MWVRAGWWVLGLALVSGCTRPIDAGARVAEAVVTPSTTSPGAAPAASDGLAATSTAVTMAPTTTSPPTDGTADDTASTTASTTTSATTSAVGTTTATTAATASSTTTTTATTTTVPLDVYDPACVVQVQPGAGLLEIAGAFDDERITAPSLRAENRLDSDVLQPLQLLDVCVDNGIDDVTGEPIGRNPMLLTADIVRQQEHLNVLFAGLGIDPLTVDGISGPVTGQRLCAARLALGLPVSIADMEPGSEEEQVLLAATSLPVPFTSAVLSDRWILIDRTCQMMFVGERADRLVYVFPTSTGQPGYETRDQERQPVVRYNAALANGGWHNSTIYPVAEDNPLNGNMYKPLYFDRGQAIHGATNVPTSPASKGCARLRVAHQDLLLGWLGLAGSGSTTNAARIGVTVNVQGVWVPR